jgi:hypothetical protein
VKRRLPALSVSLASEADAAALAAFRFYFKCGCCETGRTIYRKTPLVYYEMLL